MSPELLSLAAEEIGRLVLPWRVEGAVDAAFSVLRALTVDEARAREALHSIMAPTLLLWGADDRVIPQRLIDDVDAAHPELALPHDRWRRAPAALGVSRVVRRAGRMTGSALVEPA